MNNYTNDNNDNNNLMLVVITIVLLSDDSDRGPACSMQWSVGQPMCGRVVFSSCKRLSFYMYVTGEFMLFRKCEYVNI